MSEVNDKYILEITSSAKGLNRVADDLDRLKKSLKGFSFSETKLDNFVRFSNGITSIGKATSTIDTGKIIAFSTALKQLSSVKVSMPKGLDQSLKEIEKAFSGLGNGKDLYESVNRFARIMKPLSELKFGSLKGLPKSVEALDKAFSALGNSRDFAKTADSFTRILAPVAQLNFGGIKNAGTAVTALSTALNSLDMRTLHGQADALNRSLKPLAETMDKLAKATAGLGLTKGLGRGAGRAFEGLQSALDASTRKSGSKVGAEQDRWQKGYSNLKVDKVEDITTLSDRFDALKEKASLVATAVTGAFQRIVTVVKTATRVIKGVAKAIAVIPRAISKIGVLNPFKGIINSVSNLMKKLSTLGKSLARIAMYRALRSAIKEISQAIKEGLTNLYHWSQATGGDFAPAMDRLASSALYLKNSFGAMVSPLLTRLTPAIETATNALVNMLNVINQLFARLTGRATWTRALQYPTQYAEQASSASKKVKDNIQSFDELHILRSDNGGGGASGMDYNNMFEETEFTEGLTDWVERFKTALSNSRFYDAGNILAQQVNTLINRVPWGRLGDTLAGKINDMFQFAWGVLHNIDFVNIGTSIATFLNHAIDTIDPHTIGQVFARKWTAIVDFIYGFVTTFDFPNLGWRLSEFVQGWFDELDGARLGYTISEAIKGVLDMAISFMSNDDMFEAFVTDIADTINNIDWYGIFCRILTIGTQVLNAIAETINRVLDGGSGASGAGSGGLNVDRLQASAPPAIAQRVQAEYNYNVSRGHTGTFGEQIVQSMTTSVTSADTTALVEALKNLLKAVWRAVKATFGEIFTIGAENLAQGIDTSLSGGYYDNDGNWVVTNADRSARNGNRSWLQRLHGDGDSWWDYTGYGMIGNMFQSDVQYQRDRRGNGESRGFFGTLVDVGDAVVEANNAFWDGIFGKNATRDADRYNKSLTAVSRTTKTLTVDTTNFRKTIDSVNTGMKTTADDVSAVQSSFDTFGSKLSGDVVSRITTAKSAITTSFASMKDEATNSLGTLTANVLSTMEQTANNVTAPLQGIKNNIVTVFREAGNESVTSISELSGRMSGALNGLVQSSKGQLEGYKATWQELHGATKGVSNSVIDGSERMANAVTDAFNSLLHNLDGFEIDVPNYRFKTRPKTPLSHISIPKLATGGIVSSPTTALIGEAGKEAVIPLENNTGWMDTLADRINGNNGDEVALLREQNELLRQIASKNVTISSRDVFNAVRDENSDYITRTGQNALAF